jgi:hypothetical protein
LLPKWGDGNFQVEFNEVELLFAAKYEPISPRIWGGSICERQHLTVLVEYPGLEGSKVIWFIICLEIPVISSKSAQLLPPFIEGLTIKF